MHGNEHESESFVSVIIPVYNSSRTLSECIDSIIEQTYPNWEIIVVDSDSTDNTRRLVEAYHRKLGDKCRYYVIRNRFQAAKRNFGARKAKGDYLFLLDSDQYLPPTLLEEATKLIKNGESGLSFPETRVLMRGYLSKSLIFLRDTIDTTGAKTMGIPRLIRRDLYTKVGGQDETLNYVEDSDFSYKLRMIGVVWKRCNIPIAHDENVSFRWIIYKPYHTYPNELRLRQKWRSKFDDVGVVNRSVRYRAIVISLLRNPSYIAGVLFILTTRAVARRLGIVAYAK